MEKKLDKIHGAVIVLIAIFFGCIAIGRAVANSKYDEYRLDHDKEEVINYVSTPHHTPLEIMNIEP